MITPVVQKDPRDNITSTPVTPSPGDNTTGGNQIQETKSGDNILVNPTADPTTWKDFILLTAVLN